MAHSRCILYVVLSCMVTLVLCVQLQQSSQKADLDGCAKTGNKGCKADEEGDSSVLLQSLAQVEVIEVADVEDAEESVSITHEVEEDEADPVSRLSTLTVQAATSTHEVEEDEADPVSRLSTLTVQAATSTHEVQGLISPHAADTSKEAEEASALSWKALDTTCKECIRQGWKEIKALVKPDFEKCESSCLTSECKPKCKEAALAKATQFVEKCADQCALPSESKVLIMLDHFELGAAFLSELTEVDEDDAEEDEDQDQDQDEEDDDDEHEEDEEEDEEEEDEEEGTDPHDVPFHSDASEILPQACKRCITRVSLHAKFYFEEAKSILEDFDRCEKRPIRQRPYCKKSILAKIKSLKIKVVECAGRCPSGKTSPVGETKTTMPLMMVDMPEGSVLDGDTAAGAAFLSELMEGTNDEETEDEQSEDEQSDDGDEEHGESDESEEDEEDEDDEEEEEDEEDVEEEDDGEQKEEKEDVNTSEQEENEKEEVGESELESDTDSSTTPEDAAQSDGDEEYGETDEIEEDEEDEEEEGAEEDVEAKEEEDDGEQKEDKEDENTSEQEEDETEELDESEESDTELGNDGE